MMEAAHSQTQSSSHQKFSKEYSQSPTAASKFYSMLDKVDSEFIADQFGIGRYTAKHDFKNHLKVNVFEGIHPSDSLAELAEKTATHDQLEEMRCYRTIGTPKSRMNAVVDAPSDPARESFGRDVLQCHGDRDASVV